MFYWYSVIDDLSSGGDSKVEEDSEKRPVKEKESKDRDHEREEGILPRRLSVTAVLIAFANHLLHVIATFCNDFIALLIL